MRLLSVMMAIAIGTVSIAAPNYVVAGSDDSKSEKKIEKLEKKGEKKKVSSDKLPPGGLIPPVGTAPAAVPVGKGQ